MKKMAVVLFVLSVLTGYAKKVNVVSNASVQAQIRHKKIKEKTNSKQGCSSQKIPLEEQIAAIEEAVARDQIERILQKEKIPYRRGVFDSLFGAVDFIVPTKDGGQIGIEYGNQYEIENKDYRKRVIENEKLAFQNTRRLDYYYVPGPLTMQVGEKDRLAMVENIPYFLYEKGIIRMIKERM
jgi:hypothetical protein